MARTVRKINPDEPAHTYEDLAHTRFITLKWDPTGAQPVLSLGEVTPHEAYAWLQTAAEEIWDRISNTGCIVEND